MKYRIIRKTIPVLIVILLLSGYTDNVGIANSKDYLPTAEVKKDVYKRQVLKGCVDWARENNVDLITEEHMKIINDKRAKEKSK